MKKLLSSVLVLTSSLLLFGGLVVAQEIPEPEDFVTDLADIIPIEIENQLESTLSLYEEETSNEIAVVTVPSLQGYSIEEFTYELATTWGVGKSERNNGIVLLVAPNEREVRIEVGYGLEGALPDAAAFGIIQKTIIPEFKNNNYPTGISNGVTDIIRATQDEEFAQELASTNIFSDDFWGQVLGFLVVFFNFFFLFMSRVLGRTKSWWLGGVLGIVVGIVLNLIFGWGLWYLIILLCVIGLVMDYLLSKSYHKHGERAWWYHGTSNGGSSGSSFSFGGGSFGGGGASGSW